MFYPVESLKRGGRFYYCWVADSWPLRFAAITHKQLWSQDIRQLCDDLHEVFVNESGYPSKRFSLRLSSRLMHGLIRLYERKVTVLLGELCMIHAHVFKVTNKKLAFHKTVTRVPRTLVPLVLPPPVRERPEDEPRVEEMIQNSGNVVRNILDITLKEAAIPEFQLPPNDGFGEENPEQAFQLLADRTIEQILVQPDLSAAQYSALGLPTDRSRDKSADRSRDEAADRSRLAVDAPQMERISEHEISAFRKSTGEELLAGFDKDIPEIPEIPPPELPAPPELEKQVPTQPPVEPVPAETAAPPAAPRAEVELQLEELEAQPPAKRRREKNKLIIDKKIQLSADFLRARIDNPTVELRCEQFADATMGLLTPWHELARRPARAGAAAAFLPAFQRHCGPATGRPDRELELIVAAPPRALRPRSTLGRVVEAAAPEEPPQIHIESVSVEEVDRARAQGEHEDVARGGMEATLEVPRVSVEPLDSRPLPGAQAPPPPEDLCASPAKRPRLYDYISFSKTTAEQRQTQNRESQKEVEDLVPQEPPVDKENVPPPADQTPTRRGVCSMLLEAGLSEAKPGIEPLLESLENIRAPTQSLRPQETQVRARDGSDSETPLGSLDRTKVSLGDSVQTTDSERFIRDHWGVEGTMLKILSALKAGVAPRTVHALLARGPVLPGRARLIAARCFTSILKLKQHAFIIIDKDPETSEILDISLGARFDDI